jgi:hypothetical protein
MNHPKLDYVNGVALLLPEIEDILTKARLSRKERAVLTSIAYLLKSIPPMREDIETLKSNDLFGVAKRHPKISLLIVFIMYLFLISDVRNTIIQFLGEILEVSLKIL